MRCSTSRAGLRRLADSGVTALDRLAERLLTDAPLRVAAATSAQERAAIFTLRHAHVADHGTRLPGGLERDPYDDDALLIGAWDGGRLAGTMRLVFPETARRLPVEATFDLVVAPRGQVVEAGRLVLSPAYRGDPAHGVWGALFAHGWGAMRARGYAVLAGAASAAMVDRLRALGLPFEILGPARSHWGEQRHPVRLDASRSSPSWFTAPSRD
jgi:N-acyl-L-homoserine lactone synthetase